MSASASSSSEFRSSWDLQGLVHRSVNPFGFSMFEKMSGSQENVVISPLSIYVCLSMLAPALPAECPALRELHAVLQCQEPCNSGTGLPTAFAELLRFFTSSMYVFLSPCLLRSNLTKLTRDLASHSPNSGVKLTMANSAWFEGDFQLLSDVQLYARLLEEHVGAEVQQLTTVSALNKWCEKKTGGLIKHVVDILPQRFALINALYFKGAWSSNFEVKDTEKGAKFWTRPGKSVKCAMMRQVGSFAYLDCSEVQMLSLPYGKAKQFEMQIILPKSMTLDRFVVSPTWSLKNWNEWIHGQRVQRGRVRIPRLDITFGVVSLRKSLISMGLTSVFSSFLTGTCVEEVLHKTLLRVDEEGTVAAAVTVVTGRGGRPPRDLNVFDFCADKPFLMIIREIRTNVIIFLAQIWSPSKS